MSQSLSYQDAKKNPCLGCGAPCCEVLPLYDFAVSTLPNVEYLLYCMNFARIEAAVMNNGMWRLHYRSRCRHLDAGTGLCGLHGTPDKPGICQNYDPYGCSYRRIFQTEDSPRSVRMDRRRVQQWAERCTFNEHRELTGAPAFEELRTWLPPLDTAPMPSVPDAPVLSEWAAIARGESSPVGPEVRTWEQARDPCSGCEAWCCQRLSFPHAGPTTAANLDHMRFALGFPGVELCIDQSGNWMLEVRTACQHLLPAGERPEGGRCGVFGTPERPTPCAALDAHFCAYRGRYSRPQTHWAVRVTASTFPKVASLYGFDQGGAVTQRPDSAALHAAVEQAWREGAAPC